MGGLGSELGRYAIVGGHTHHRRLRATRSSCGASRSARENLAIGERNFKHFVLELAICVLNTEIFLRNLAV